MAAVRGAITDYACAGTLDIDGLVLNCPAWSVGDLWQLWGATFDYRGAVRNLPQSGSITYPRYPTATTFTLPLLITGHVTQAGAANADPMRGLQANLATLAAGLLPLPASGPSSTARVFTVTLPDGSTRTSYGHTLGIKTGSVTVGIMRATIDLLAAEPFS